VQDIRVPYRISGLLNSPPLISTAKYIPSRCHQCLLPVAHSHRCLLIYKNAGWYAKCKCLYAVGTSSYRNMGIYILDMSV